GRGEGHADSVRDRARARGAADRRRPRGGGEQHDGRVTTAVLPDGFVSSLFSLENRVAVVAGGGSGLGAAIAAGLAQAGAAVAVVDVDAERAAEGCASIADARRTAAPFTAGRPHSSAADPAPPPPGPPPRP